MRLEDFVGRVGLHLGRGTWKRAAILAVVFLVGGLSAGCGTPPPLPPLNFTSDALRNSGKGVAVFGVQISDHIGIKVGCGPMTAILVPTEPTAAPRSVWAFGTLREPRGVVVLQTELPGGTYGVANITCKSGNDQIHYVPPAGQQFAKFTIQPGEVLDLGILSVSVWVRGEPSLFSQSKPLALVFVDPLPENSRSSLRPDIASKVQRKAMQPVFSPTLGEINEACESQRARRRIAIAAIFSSDQDAPACSRGNNAAAAKPAGNR